LGTESVGEEKKKETGLELDDFIPVQYLKVFALFFFDKNGSERTVRITGTSKVL
jgi:hypothetical protein